MEFLPPGIFVRSQLRTAGALLGLSILCASCEPETALDHRILEVTNGTDDDSDSAVVALRRGGAIVCTGTLVSPRVVVTAGHCVVPRKPNAVVFGAAPTVNDRSIGVLEAVAHPAFDRKSLVNDVALLLLAAPASEPPWPLLTRPFEEAFVGERIRLVGYGRTNDPASGGGVHKHQGTTRVSAYSDTDFTFHPDPSQTCAGDSGGPAFLRLEGIEYLAGITSNGDARCSEYGVDTRVDAYVASFIRPYLESIGDGSTAPGQRAGRGGCSVGGRATSQSFEWLPVLLLLGVFGRGRAKLRRARSTCAAVTAAAAVSVAAVAVLKTAGRPAWAGLSAATATSVAQSLSTPARPRRVPDRSQETRRRHRGALARAGSPSVAAL